MKLILALGMITAGAFGHQTPYAHSHGLLEEVNLKEAWILFVVGFVLVTLVRAWRSSGKESFLFRSKTSRR